MSTEDDCEHVRRGATFIETQPNIKKNAGYWRKDNYALCALFLQDNEEPKPGQDFYCVCPEKCGLFKPKQKAKE
jgi:hypothetical protein